MNDVVDIFAYVCKTWKYCEEEFCVIGSDADIDGNLSEYGHFIE
jgi:hypothetical protein